MDFIKIHLTIPISSEPTLFSSFHRFINTPMKNSFNLDAKDEKVDKALVDTQLQLSKMIRDMANKTSKNETLINQQSEQ